MAFTGQLGTVDSMPGNILLGTSGSPPANVLSCAGVGTLSAVGIATASAVLAASGSGSAAFVGSSTQPGVLTAAGTSSATFIVARGVLTAAGTSPVTFTGSTVATIDFTFSGGIASTASVGAPTLLSPVAERLITVFVNGIDRTEYVRVNPGVEFSMNAGSGSTASFTVFSNPGSYRPAVNEEVIVYKGSTRLFRGTVEAPMEEWYNGTTGMDVRVRCNDLGTRLSKRIISKWVDTVIQYSAGSLIRDIFRYDLADMGISVSTWADSAGAINPTDLVFDHVPMTDVLRRLLEPDNLDWSLDAHDTLHIFSKTSGTTAAPYDLSDDDGQFDFMRVERQRGKFANRVGVRNQQRLPSFWTDTFVGDGSVRYFITTYVLNEKPVVLVNGIQATVIENNAYSLIPHDFSYTTGGNGVFSNPYNSPYTSSDTIEVIYPSLLQPIVWAQDDTSITNVGKFEVVEEVKEAAFSMDRLQEIADGLLARYLNVPYSVEFGSRLDGFVPGQLINIDTTRPLVPNIDLVIKSVSGREEQKKLFRYTVKATNEQIQGGGDLVQSLANLSRLVKQPIDRHRVVVVIKLAEDIQGITNPGLVTGMVPGSREIDKPGAIKEVRARFGTGPATSTIQIDIFKNGVSIFPLTATSPSVQTYLEYDPGDTRRVVYQFVDTPMLVADGDIFTAEVVTADAAAMNGTVEIEIQS